VLVQIVEFSRHEVMNHLGHRGAPSWSIPFSKYLQIKKGFLLIKIEQCTISERTNTEDCCKLAHTESMPSEEMLVWSKVIKYIELEQAVSPLWPASLKQQPKVRPKNHQALCNHVATTIFKTPSLNLSSLWFIHLVNHATRQHCSSNCRGLADKEKETMIP
jgi:hypothetical protein